MSKAVTTRREEARLALAEWSKRIGMEVRLDLKRDLEQRMMQAAQNQDWQSGQAGTDRTNAHSINGWSPPIMPVTFGYESRLATQADVDRYVTMESHLGIVLKQAAELQRAVQLLTDALARCAKEP